MLMYKRKRTHSGTLNTPVTFFRQTNTSPFPDNYTLVEQFSCLAEMYESSTKDMQSVNMNNAKNVVTLNIPNPRMDYRIRHDDVFILQSSMYQDLEFQVEHFAPNDDLLKIVGVAYG